MAPLTLPLFKALCAVALFASNTIAQGDSAPSFFPPLSTDANTHVIRCQYPSMRGWVHTNFNNGAWLNNYGFPRPGQPRSYDINTDNDKYVPQGITRRYRLEVTEQSVNLDGQEFKRGKIFNKQYPGPWIQACWGDDLEITVVNKLKHNGTAIHWHGIRMMNNVLNDGVPGITQCPIPPGSSQVYRFKATQYGTTWYHSHYSLQYGDGLLGPLTIHGPSSSHYERSIDPFLMTDHNHRSAFEDYYQELDRIPPPMDGILLNGKGDIQNTGALNRKVKHIIQPGKKYLLRLINTSVDTTFVFSVDGHRFTVIQADFVPIEPYETDHIVVGIGQRYHVILQGKSESEVRRNHRFWARITPSEGCQNFKEGAEPDDRRGIFYYRRDDDIAPDTQRGDFSLACRDESFDKLKPKVKWTVPDPGLGLPGIFQKTGDVAIDEWRLPGRPETDRLVSNWEIGPSPMWINFSEPIVGSLERNDFPETWVVYPAEEHIHDKWVYLLITGMKSMTLGIQIPVAHPIHLHGHDFALLQQSTEPWNVNKLNPKLDNPPRRDVTLLPAGGFIIIAFKPDNPGSWLLHCHIAWHASSGLAMQILERKNDLKASFQNNRDYRAMKDQCRRWNEWYGDENNHWNPDDFFQDDSGI